MDTLKKEQRSALMSRIRSKGTKPELKALAAAKALRLRPATHRLDLPGKPDMAFNTRKAAVFVNGCFWHGHDGCAKARTPKSNIGFWAAKLAANKARDQRNKRDLRRMGWRVMTVWECRMDGLEGRLRRFLCKQKAS
jgi:DNA mismatch endonuclease (patch repair protein)